MSDQPRVADGTAEGEPAVMPGGIGHVGDEPRVEGDAFAGGSSDGGPSGSGGGRPILVVAMAVGFIAVVFIVILFTRDTGESEQVNSPLLGKVAPPIVGSTIDGSTYDLDRERGRWVVVNFFSPTCVPCVVEHPELIEFAENGGPFGDAGVVSVAFATREVEVAEFFEERGGDWPVVARDTSPIVLDYVTAQVPESFIVDPNGRVRAKLIGGVTEEDLNNAILEVATRLNAPAEEEGS